MRSDAGDLIFLGYFDKESLEDRYDIEVMVITGKVETAQALHGCHMQSISGPQRVVQHVLQHGLNVFGRDLNTLKKAFHKRAYSFFGTQ